MKPKYTNPFIAFAAAASALALTSTSVHAASATWNGTTDSLWATTTNWTASPVPGVGNTATFNNAGNANTTITVGNISLLSLLFDTANAAAYTLGSGSISLGSAGNFTVNSTVTTTQTVNTALALNGGYTFTNNSVAGGQSLSIGGGISSATAGTKTLAVNGAGNTTISGNISNGSGGIGLTKNGAGTLTLNGATNSIIGGDFGIGTAGGNGGTVRIASGASVTTSAASRLLLGLNTGQSGTFTMDVGAGTVTFGGSRGSLANYIGVDGGTGTVNANGGTLNFTGMANGSGHLLIGANGNTSNGTMTVAGGTVNVGTRIQMGSGFPGDAAAGWGANGNGNATLTISSGAVNIGTAGAGDADSDKGFLYLKGSTSGTGTATVNLDGGTLSLAKFQIGAGGTSRVVNFNGGTVQARASRTDFLGTGATLNVKDNGAIIDTNNFNITIAGSLLNGGTGVGGLTKNSAGTLTLSGTNTYTGATTLTGGSLSVGASNNLGASAANLVFDGGSLQITGTALTNFSTIGHTVSFNATKSVGLDISSAGHTFTVDQVLNQTTGGFTKAGAGSVILNQANTYTGVTTLSAGTLSVATIGDGGVAGNLGQATNAASNLVFNGGTLDYTGANAASNRAFTIIAGKTATINTANNLSLAGATGAATTGALTKTGAGILTLTGASNYTGATTVNGGTLRVSGSGSIGTGAATVSGSGSILDVARNDTWGNHSGSVQALTIQSGGLVTNGAVVNSGYNTVQTLALDGGELRVTGTARAVTNEDLFRFEAYGIRNTVTVTGTTASSITNPTSIANAGINIGGFTDQGGGIGSSLTFNVADVTSSSAADLTVSAVLKNNSTSAQANLSNGLIKTGGGTMTLSASNRYTGATTISTGTLDITGTGSINSTTAISVAAGAQLIYNSSTALTVSPALNGAGTSSRAVLGGTGPINAAVTLNNLGDTLAPGNSPGIQTFTPAQTWSSFSYDWELNNFITKVLGTNHDQLSLASTLSLNGGVGAYQLNVLGLTAGNLTGAVPGFAEANQQWTILTSVGAITGFDAANWTINTSGFSNNTPFGGNFTLTSDTNNLFLNYNAIPEPSAALLVGLGSLALLRRRRH